MSTNFVLYFFSFLLYFYSFEAYVIILMKRFVSSIFANYKNLRVFLCKIRDSSSSTVATPLCIFSTVKRFFYSPFYDVFDQYLISPKKYLSNCVFRVANLVAFVFLRINITASFSRISFYIHL